MYILRDLLYRVHIARSLQKILLMGAAVRRQLDMIQFLKAVTNSFQILISKVYFCELYALLVYFSWSIFMMCIKSVHICWTMCLPLYLWYTSSYMQLFWYFLVGEGERKTQRLADWSTQKNRGWPLPRDGVADKANEHGLGDRLAKSVYVIDWFLKTTTDKEKMVPHSFSWLIM